MPRIDHRDVTTLLLQRLIDAVDPTVHVLAPHESAPPGDPAHDDYYATWARLQPVAFEPLDRNSAQSQDAAAVAVTVQIAATPRGTGLAPLAVETAAETVAAALDHWTGLSGTLRLTLGRASTAVHPEPDPETRFRTALVTAPGTADRT